MTNICVRDYFLKKLLPRNTDTHRTDCSDWTTKVVGKHVPAALITVTKCQLCSLIHSLSRKL